MTVNASVNGSTLNTDVGIILNKYTINDPLGVEIYDADNGLWEIC